MIKPIKKKNNHYSECKRYREEFYDKHGYLFCENCGINNSFSFCTHHIVFASEAPHHPELQNNLNKILVCDKCHDEFHGKKREMRKKWVIKRDLETLFNMNLYDKL